MADKLGVPTSDLTFEEIKEKYGKFYKKKDKKTNWGLAHSRAHKMKMLNLFFFFLYHRLQCFEKVVYLFVCCVKFFVKFFFHSSLNFQKSVNDNLHSQLQIAQILIYIEKKLVCDSKILRMVTIKTHHHHHELNKK